LLVQIDVVQYERMITDVFKFVNMFLANFSGNFLGLSFEMLRLGEASQMPDSSLRSESNFLSICKSCKDSFSCIGFKAGLYYNLI
jgi:hypothetical protein